MEGRFADVSKRLGAGSPTDGIARLLGVRPVERTSSLTPREVKVDAVAGAAYVLATIALAVALSPAIRIPVGRSITLVVTYAVLARVRLMLRNGYVLPTQLALVPMLLLLPPALVPAFVGAGFILSRAPEVLTRTQPTARLLTSIANGWYVLAPALLLALVSPHAAIAETSWPVWIAALVLQLGSDAIVTTLRQGVGTGQPFELPLDLFGQVVAVDSLLSAIGLLAAFSSQHRPYAFLLTLPMIVGLALFARERASRIAHALALIDDLDRERERALTAQRRIGETAAANLDRGSLERIIVATAVELVGGDFGRLSIAARADEPLSSRVCHSSANGHVALIEQVERSAAEGAGSVRAIAPDGSAMALRLDRPDVARCVLSVARSGRPFTMREQELLRTHAEQASVCLQNVALHERVERLAGTDELTGLLNHRRLQEILGREVRRAERHGGALALVMLDIDNFKAINDVYGHQQGDAVLRAVSATLQSSIRAIDFAARYGGEELAVVLPDCEIGQAATTAERIRHAIASLHVPLRCGRTISVTASLGVASLDVETRTRQQLVEAADAALYVAKRAGKNRVEVAAGVVVA